MHLILVNNIMIRKFSILLFHFKLFFFQRIKIEERIDMDLFVCVCVCCVYMICIRT